MRPHRFLPALALLLLAVVTLGAAPASTPTFRLWGALQGGPHPVGFRWLEVGSEDGHARLRLALWYPAQGYPTAPSRPAMRLAGYFGAGELESWLRRGLAPEAASGLTATRLEELAAAPTAAVENALAARGPFPLVVYVRGAAETDSVRAEYLASHGFVVASLPMGASGMDPAAFERRVKDLELAVSSLRRLLGKPDPEQALPSVTSSVGLVAFSSNSLAVLLLEARAHLADAVVTLEGWEGYEGGARLLAQMEGKPLEGFRAPLLSLVAGSLEGKERDWSVFESLHAPGSVRREVIPGLGHFGLLAAGRVTGLGAPAELEGYEDSCLLTLAFLREHL